MREVRGKAIAEKILSAKSGQDARAGDMIVCDADLVIGTDASAPMAISYFEKMGGASVRHPERVVFALDHYDPTTSPDRLMSAARLSMPLGSRPRSITDDPTQRAACGWPVHDWM